MKRPYFYIQNVDSIEVIKSNKYEDPEIIIRASTDKLDRQGEIVLKSAFNDQSMQTEFRKEGFYDYNHITDSIESEIKKASGSELVNLHESRLEGIVGYPNRNDSGLYTKQDGVYSEGKLLSKTKFGSKIIEFLRSGFGSVGASISGFVNDEDIKDGKIFKVHLRKIALQPTIDSINNETFAKFKSVYGGIITPNMGTDEVSKVIEDSNHEQEEMERLEEILCKVDFLYDFITNSDLFKNQLAKDIQFNFANANRQIDPNELIQFLTEMWKLPNSLSNDILSQIKQSGLIPIK